MHQSRTVLVLSGVLAALLSGCGTAPSAPPAPPPAPVEVAIATSGSVAEVVTALGSLVAVDVVHLSAKTVGVVHEIHLEDGARVERGTLLVELDRAENLALVHEAEAERDNLARELAVKLPLLAAKIISSNDMAALKAQLAGAEARVAAAQARLDGRRIYAPFTGRLGLRAISLGALVSPGTVVATVTSIAPIKLQFAVPETHLARLKPGLTVKARAVTFGERVFTGTVIALDAAIDPATRAIGVQALLANEDEALRPGLSMSVELILGEQADAITVPEQAVLLQGEEAAVFVVVDAEGKTVARRTVVHLGRRDNGRIQLLDGVTAGARVVVQGPLVLRDGAAVAVKEAAAPAPASTSAPAPATASPATPAAPAPAPAPAPAATAAAGSTTTPAAATTQRTSPAPAPAAGGGH